jgi:hypothetical protein
MQAIAHRSAYTHDAPMSFSRHSAWLLAALVFGAVALPFLVYYTGVATLGPYSRGGPFDFYGEFLGSLARLRWSAWTLLLGPAACVLLWRALVAYAWPRGA